MSAPAEHAVGDPPARYTVASSAASEPHARTTTAPRRARSLAAFRSVVEPTFRRAVRWFRVRRGPRTLTDRWVLVGLAALIGGAAGWIFVDAPSDQSNWVLAASLTLTGAFLLSGRLASVMVRQRSSHLGVLQAASARMSRATTVESVGRAIVEEIGRYLDYHNVRVYIIEPPDEVVPIAFEGRVGAYEQVDLAVLRTRFGEGFTGWVAEHGVPLLVNDAGRDPRGARIPGTDEVDESMVVVPMRYDQRTVGVITLSKLGLGQFAGGDLRVLSILADQAATALETARQLARSDGLAAELRRLLDMSSALAQSLDPREVAELMARHLADALGVESCTISSWDRPGDRLLTLGYHPRDQGLPPEPVYRLAEFPESRRVLDGQRLVQVDVDDPLADSAERRILEAEGNRSLLMLPLVAKGAAIGLVELNSATKMVLEESTVGLARTMANEAAMALENAMLYERTRALADRDPLTGCFNHRYFHERLGEELLRAARGRRTVSVLMLDLDEFKRINDTFGHLFGDRVLAWTAETLRSSLRDSDVAGRYGGDEFAVILPEADGAAAGAVADRILATFRTETFREGSRGPVPVAVSIGIATYPADGMTAADLIAAADAALYDMKRTGGGAPLPAAGA